MSKQRKSISSMSRTPRSKVRRVLRQEVGFGCPIPTGDDSTCGSPYLTWHHFDPPWNVRHHEDARGIVALCSDHHRQADRGTWTKEQLREFKRMAKTNRQHVEGRFEWMRNQLLCVAGGNTFYNVPVLLYCSRQPIIWFSRDSQGYLQVNLRRPQTDRIAEPVMVDNDWVIPNDVVDIECPPGGHLLAVRYPNGDSLRVEFHQVESSQKANLQTFSDMGFLTNLSFPLVAVTFQLKIPKLNININSKSIRLPHKSTVQNSLFEDIPIALAIGEVGHAGVVGIHIG